MTEEKEPGEARINAHRMDLKMCLTVAMQVCYKTL